MIWPQTSLAYLAAMVPECMSVRIIDAIAEEMSIEAFFSEVHKEKPRFFVTYITGTTFSFNETFVDDGDTDMVAAMRAYHEVGYRYAMMPDHTPRVAGDTDYGHIGRAFAVGHMRALMQAVGAD